MFLSIIGVCLCLFYFTAVVRAYFRLLLLWPIDCPHDGGGVPLIHPAEVTLWLRDQHLREEMLPHPAEGGIYHGTPWSGQRTKRLVELHPDLSLRGGHRKKLEIVALVAWYTAREQNGMGLGIIRDEIYHLLTIGKRQSVGWKTSSVAMNLTGEPVLQQMCLGALKPLFGDGVEETEHLPYRSTFQGAGKYYRSSAVPLCCDDAYMLQ